MSKEGFVMKNLAIALFALVVIVGCASQVAQVKPVSAPAKKLRTDVYTVDMFYDDEKFAEVFRKVGSSYADHWANQWFDPKNFPTARKGITTELDVFLLVLGRPMSSDEAIAEMKKQGYRPLTIRELLALLSQHPELQKEFLAALGTAWKMFEGQDKTFVPCVLNPGSGVEFCSFEQRLWTHHWRLPVTPKYVVRK
jgi:hypothetical protein